MASPFGRVQRPTRCEDYGWPISHRLVGENQYGEWLAFECKGRSSKPSLSVRSKAKQQAQRLTSVDSLLCKLHIGAISYFHRDKLEFHWRDPEPERTNGKAPIAVRLPEDAWKHYYAPALALAAEGGTSGAPEARAAADVKVEIWPRIRVLLTAGDWQTARSFAHEARELQEKEGFHPDGVNVISGKTWTKE